MEWHSVIVEGSRLLEGVAVDLDDQLQRLGAAGWTVRWILTNGVNRWTIICNREQETTDAHP